LKIFTFIFTNFIWQRCLRRRKTWNLGWGHALLYYIRGLLFICLNSSSQQELFDMKFVPSILTIFPIYVGLLSSSLETWCFELSTSCGTRPTKPCPKDNSGSWSKTPWRSWSSSWRPSDANFRNSVLKTIPSVISIAELVLILLIRYSCKIAYHSLYIFNQIDK